MTNLNLDVISAGNSRDISILCVRSIVRDPIDALNVAGMLHGIEDRLSSGDRICRLRIWGHGAPGSFFVGNVPFGLSLESDEELHRSNFAKSLKVWHNVTMDSSGENIVASQNIIINSDSLRRLNCKFASDGWVEIHACNVAEGETGVRLLAGLARIWGRPVVGATGAQYVGGGFENTVVTAMPNGGVHRRYPTCDIPLSNIDGSCFSGDW